MNYKTQLLITIIPFMRNILKDVSSEKNIIIPDHFNLIIDSAMAGVFVYYIDTISREDFLDTTTMAEIVELIYSSNINSFSSVSITEDYIYKNYPFLAKEIILEKSLAKDFAYDYERLLKNKRLILTIISLTIKNTITETAYYLKSSKDFYNGTGRIALPVNFFLNCFVHPVEILSDDDMFYSRNEILYNYSPVIDSYCDDISTDFHHNAVEFINGFLKTIK